MYGFTGPRNIINCDAQSIHAYVKPPRCPHVHICCHTVGAPPFMMGAQRSVLSVTSHIHSMILRVISSSSRFQPLAPYIFRLSETRQRFSFLRPSACSWRSAIPYTYSQGLYSYKIKQTSLSLMNRIESNGQNYC